MSHPSTSRWRGRTAAVLVAALAPLAASASVAQAAPSAQARLASVAAKSPNRAVVAIAQFKPGVSERRARALVRLHHGRVTARLPAVHGFAVALPARQARALRRSRSVLNLTLNTRVHGTGIDAGTLATTYPQSVGADKLWAAGITGKGVGVAVIDSGVDGSLPDFTNADGSSRIVANVMASPGATLPGDEVGHGTHVAGIIAGNHAGYIGIAPEASLIALKTADDAGTSTVLDVITALQFAVEHKDDLNVRVINLSVSSDTPDSYLDDPLNAAVEYAWHAGIVVVAAAGNRGDASDAVEYAPGNDPYVISVGATDEAGTADRGDDTVAAFSSRGITLDGVAKPDVVAPGAHIVAPLAPGSAFATLCPQCVVGGAYLRIGGTSMAAPVVAGAAALLLQARPELNPDQVKALLTGTSGGTGDGLDVAGQFAVLAGSTVTSTGPSEIDGDLGVSPGTAVTGAPSVDGSLHSADAVAEQAKSDLTAAYTRAAGRTQAATVAGDLGGRVLRAGVYKSGSSLGLTGTLTLDAQGDPNASFVFQAGSTLTTASASRVRLVNGAQACNVFWQVGSSATLGTTTDFVGNILALASITMNNDVTLTGRALARNGAVTLINDTITAAHCAAGPARELDVATALTADAGVGANQGVRPNHAVEDTLVAAGVDPTRASWSKATWTKATWTKATWTKATWTKATWTGGVAAPWAKATWTRAPEQ